MNSVIANYHHSLALAQMPTNHRLRDPVTALITKGFATLKLDNQAQASVWAALDSITHVPSHAKAQFCFPDRTEGFLSMGGEHAKYTDNVDLCDRFCFWHKHRAFHESYELSTTSFYSSVANSEALLWALAQELIDGLWSFFHNNDSIHVRNHSYVQLCAYENAYQVGDRKYMQDRHEDGHLVTLIKPTRDGLVIFPNDVETPVHLADDEVLVITGSLLTALSDGQIPPMYHAVKNPKMAVSRKSLVYFAIPDLSQTYTTLLGKKPLNVAALANESHRAFGNTALV
ncbi:2OG-Fe(II) oxygenase family protein [Rhodoferax antarcticus]|uniref:2OG-Fe(II) oxygenase family protein n=1 Tax=Rhodoferax antarcticus TaxID=81479 RepID=UPI0012EB3353|nr:2OG-Fe(II) oxygenase family protein [Rhodoferax antarcticus]MCW2314400.1 hypothetical protein [Rhodoferax antarcticus]